MQYLRILEDDPARQLAGTAPPFGPGLSRAEILPIVRLEVWGTEWTDADTDYTEFRAFSHDGRCVAVRRIAGY